MAFKQLLAEKVVIGPSLEQFLPASYQLVGDVMLLNINPKLQQYYKQIGDAILEIYPYLKTVCVHNEISGEFREPNVIAIAGCHTETIHQEFGCKFKLDTSKVMWSKGNHNERKRMINTFSKLPDAIVIDMFAGVGYWTIPIAKFAKKVYAIEKNTAAFDYLEENIRLNRLTNIVSINSDCITASLPEKADVVIMGYFPGTITFLNKGLEFVKRNGLIYYHDTAYSIDDLKQKFKSSKVKIKSIQTIKSFAPGVYHFVVELQKSK